MPHKLEKRFGTTAVKLGFITAIQLHEAMAIQLDEDLYGREHRLIGQILLERGDISASQIREVLKQMGFPTRFCLFDDNSQTGSAIMQKPDRRKKTFHFLNR